MNSLDNQPQDQRVLQVELAERMQRLLENEDFNKIFSEIFIDAFAITNLYNLHMYDQDGRRRFLEKSIARSVFSAFIDDILEDGRQAKVSLEEDKLEEDV